MRITEDWRARMETVKGTFSSRVGQICNAALDRSIIAYNENSDDEDRWRCREETETLAILVGLEIDSAKSGVCPDLDEYLGQRTVKRTPFLQYKNLVERAEERRAWYEPTFAQRLEDFFKSVDWSEVNSNVERLPYLARKLKKHTPKIKDKPAADSELFIFAQRPGWQTSLDSGILAQVGALLEDYEAVLSHIRTCSVALADGLELGSLRMTDVAVPAELEEHIRAILPKGLSPEVVCTLIAYYAANKPEDSDWVVLPVASFDAYFGTTSFGRKYLRLTPEEILERPDSGFGICRYRVRDEYRI